MIEAIPNRDLKHIWHPCSQMQDYQTFPPLHIVRAEGPFLFTADGGKLIDAISSWWCKSLGHAHPRIAQAVKKQIEKFEHVIMANTCSDVLVELSEMLTSIIPSLSKVFYTDNGSSSVEIAIKMSLQYHAQSGNPEKTGFLALENGYHGETILTLAAGDCDLYSAPYSCLMPKIPKITRIPYVYGKKDPLWQNMADSNWLQIEKLLNRHRRSLAGIILEPILQGAGGMKIYSPDFLTRLRKWTSQNNVHLIADEILTGFGRTGKMLACQHPDITPDFVCLSKGLTAGWGPMAAVLTNNTIFEAFYDDYSTKKAFMHSNTYCGYPLAAAAALEALKIYQEEKTFEKVSKKSCELRRRMEEVAGSTKAITNIRSIGFMVAGDIVNPATGDRFRPERRIGYQCYREAVELGALLRPLGDTIYFLPPLNTQDKVLDDLAEITAKAVKIAVYNLDD